MAYNLTVQDVALSGRIDENKGANIASAATTDIGSLASGATGNFVHITGTTTITSLGTASQAGVKRTVVFDGALTLTHNATSLILPGAANILTVAGDSATFIADTTANWKCTSYQRAATLNTTSGLFLNKQVLTAGTTYTPTSGTKSALIQMWGGGGAGGSAAATAGGSQGGGGSGGYAEYLLTGVTGSYSYAIGAGGTASAGAVGGNGGNTTFTAGVTITAFGGTGGGFTTAGVTKTANGGTGAVISTNGLYNGAGAPGNFGITTATATIGAAGSGGSTSLGGAGLGGQYITATAVPGGAAVANTGSGGGGGGTGTTTVAAGGAGAAGVIIITEYQ